MRPKTPDLRPHQPPWPATGGSRDKGHALSIWGGVEPVSLLGPARTGATATAVILERSFRFGAGPVDCFAGPSSDVPAPRLVVVTARRGRALRARVGVGRGGAVHPPSRAAGLAVGRGGAPRAGWRGVAHAGGRPATADRQRKHSHGDHDQPGAGGAARASARAVVVATGDAQPSTGARGSPRPAPEGRRAPPPSRAPARGPGGLPLGPRRGHHHG